MLSRITAKQKRFALGAAVLLGVIGAAWASDSGAERNDRKREEKTEPIKGIIAPKNTREFGLEALEGKLNKLADKVDDLEDGGERVIQRAVTRTQARYEEKVASLEKQLAMLTSSIDDLKKSGVKVSETRGGTEPIAAGLTDKPRGNISGRTPSSQWNLRYRASEADEFFKSEPEEEPITSELAGTGTGATEMGTNNKAALAEVAVLSEDLGDEEDASNKDADIVYELPPIPSASMFKATNITGLDVPTNAVAKENPYPALMRIKDLAILPNRFRADIRECHALFSGYGEISSERAYLRATTLSCIRKDGAVLESKMEAYVVGEDGKAGVRGRLIERQGKFLANAALAGVADGVAKVFSTTAVPTIATGTPGSTMAFQRVLSGQSAQSAAVSGASSAAQLLANYYIQRAEEITPILEIDAGRALSFVLIKPLEMKFTVIKAKTSKG
ncbi:MAG: TrbI/VirB10 family protein [Porticoccaceae bacterium]